MRSLIILSFIVVLAMPRQAYAQGCSDAGFCTMGAMKPDQAYSKKIDLKLRSLEVSYYRGTTTLTPVISVINLDLSVGISDKFGFQVKLPYQMVTGNFGNTAGLGDISLSFTGNLVTNENYDINATIGAKIPTNKSDLASDGKKIAGTEGAVYPMYYQTSLGSFDIVAGASLISKNWLIAAGYQQALTANNNTYDSLDWIGKYPSESYVKEYPKSTKLKRGVDLMLRLERNFRFVKYNFTVGLLPIFRVTKDQIVDETTGDYVKLDGTTGMALSGLVGFGYNLNVNNSLKLTLGKKITQRKVNPDGLTRDFIFIIAYQYRF